MVYLLSADHPFSSYRLWRSLCRYLASHLNGTIDKPADNGRHIFSTPNGADIDEESWVTNRNASDAFRCRQGFGFRDKIGGQIGRRTDTNPSSFSSSKIGCSSGRIF